MGILLLIFLIPIYGYVFLTTIKIFWKDYLEYRDVGKYKCYYTIYYRIKGDIGCDSFYAVHERRAKWFLKKKLRGAWHSIDKIEKWDPES